MTTKPADKPRVRDTDDPPKQWRLKCEDYSAARRALYATRAHLS